jgi:hypothetical protein
MKKNSKGTIVISLAMSVVLILVGLLVWPNGEKKKEIVQSNEIDASKTQIKVIAKRINIRKEPTISSEDIGDVYSGEIYTVLEDLEKEDYYWYKIKTNNDIEGFIASSKNEEYVELVSGYIDRTPPVIDYDKDYYVLYKGIEDYSLITCKDENGSCTISVTKNNLYLDIVAKDDKGNTSKKSIRYYEVFNGGNYFNETNNDLSIYYTRTINNDGSLYITANYILNRMILSDNKSKSYNTNINLYDENFNIINSYETKYNTKELDNDCINTNGMILKDEYLDTNLNVGNKLCSNFYIPNGNNVKYFEISISGVDNYDKGSNYLSNYSSRIFTK